MGVNLSNASIVESCAYAIRTTQHEGLQRCHVVASCSSWKGKGRARESMSLIFVPNRTRLDSNYFNVKLFAHECLTQITPKTRSKETIERENSYPTMRLITLALPRHLWFLSAEDNRRTSTPSSPLTVHSSAPPHSTNQHQHQHQYHDHHDNSLTAVLDPLDILTAEGRLGTAPGWLSGEASGSKIVVSGMDKIGELDQREVRF